MSAGVILSWIGHQFQWRPSWLWLRSGGGTGQLIVHDQRDTWHVTRHEHECFPSDYKIFDKKTVRRKVTCLRTHEAEINNDFLDLSSFGCNSDLRNLHTCPEDQIVTTQQLCSGVLNGIPLLKVNLSFLTVTLLQRRIGEPVVAAVLWSFIQWPQHILHNILLAESALALAADTRLLIASFVTAAGCSVGQKDFTQERQTFCWNPLILRGTLGHRLSGLVTVVSYLATSSLV